MLEKKKYVELIANLKFVKIQLCSQMECFWTVHQLNVGRLVGLQAAQARPEWAMLMRKTLTPWPILSISGYDDTTSPHQTF